MKKPACYVGNDISKDTFDSYFIQKDGSHQLYQFTNDIEGWIKFEASLLPQDICVVEATGAYHLGLATYLYNKGWKVAVVNPLSVKYFPRMKLVRAKTDKADAQLISEYGQSTQPNLWVPQPAHLTETIKEIEQYIKELILCHYSKMNNSLQSIPGIGPKTAATLILITAGFTKFNGYKALIAYAGLAPRTYQSGTSVKGHLHICKLGARQLRKLLYQCAQSAKRFNPVCKILFDRLYNDKKKPFKVAMIAVANKLLKLAFTIATSGQEFDPRYHLKFQTTK